MAVALGGREEVCLNQVDPRVWEASCPKWCRKAYVDLIVVLFMCKWDVDAVRVRCTLYGEC